MLERISIVSKKKVLAQVATHKEEVDELVGKLVDQLNSSVRERTSLQNRIGQAEERVLAVEALNRDSEEWVVKAEERTKAAEATCAQVMACHTGRVRIGSIPIFDAIEMTARTRAVEGSLRCETDGEKIVAYGDRQITEAEWNALVETSTPQWDRT